MKVILNKNAGSSDNKERRRASIQDRLARLVQLQGSDAGFFHLAVHSFIEAHLRDRFQDYSDRTRFSDVLYQFKRELTQNATHFIRGLGTLDQLRGRQDLANQVRHRFQKVDPEEARSSAFRLIEFCKLAELPQFPEIDQLSKSLELWERRESRWEDMEELSRVGFRLRQIQKEHESLIEEVATLREARDRLDEVATDREFLEQKLTDALATAKQKDLRVDELRQERNRLEGEQKRLSEQLRDLEEAREYVESMSRMSLYTRSRLEYEQTVTRLTHEQQRIVDQIALTSDFLVKGAAGTGKTLVLLKALEKALTASVEELPWTDAGTRVALLTYTNTLVKYDQYLTSLLAHENLEESITTADSFLLKRLKQVKRAYVIDYDIARELAKELNRTGFLSDAELFEEVENFLFANDISEKEYLIDGISRTGMKKPLGNTQRRTVWQIRDQIAVRMESTGRLSKNYSRLRLIWEKSTNTQSDGALDCDLLFIDEIQDLSPVDIKALKAYTTRAVIMAGDADQAIYASSLPLSRAGVDVVGKTRILKTNFRNTVQIHELAEKYRTLGENREWDSENGPEAFRVGPVPELFRVDSDPELLQKVAGRCEFFVRQIGYDPENICILAPTSAELDAIAEVLRRSQFESSDLRQKEFRFEQTDVIRLSTMHSGKGLDFPVVLLYLNKLPYVGDRYDASTKEKIIRNLIYVAITRAMDHVNVLCPSDPAEAPIKNLIAVFDGLTGQFGSGG